MDRPMMEGLEQLIAAVRAGDLETMRAVLDRQVDGHAALLNAAVDGERRDRPSDTAAMRLIHVAVAENRRDALQWLIEHGADLNARNADGRMALHDCFELGRDDLAQLLLQAGAEADVCAAAAYGMHGRLQEILAGGAAHANDLRTGLSPLGWSAYGNQVQAALILIQHGAIVDRPPYDAEAWGPTAHVANTTFAMMLLGHGANPNCQDEDGDTPIHAAIKSRIAADAEPFVEILLAAGADCGIRNHAGRTALDEALLQQGEAAETYFPAKSLGAKRLERVIELLR
jgi:ankyrin repeat protein